MIDKRLGAGGFFVLWFQPTSFDRKKGQWVGREGVWGGSGAFKLHEYPKSRPVYAYSGAPVLINCLLRSQKKELSPVAYVCM